MKNVTDKLIHIDNKSSSNALDTKGEQNDSQQSYERFGSLHMVNKEFKVYVHSNFNMATKLIRKKQLTTVCSSPAAGVRGSAS